MEMRDAQLVALGFKMGFKDAVRRFTCFAMDQEINEDVLAQQFARMQVGTSKPEEGGDGGTATIIPIGKGGEGA